MKGKIPEIAKSHVSSRVLQVINLFLTNSLYFLKASLKSFCLDSADENLFPTDLC